MVRAGHISSPAHTFQWRGPGTGKTADELTQRIIATVNAVQAGEFGQSIPDGVQGATVTLVVDCGDTAITPLATQAIEVLRERLGKSMPIMVQSNPDAARTGAHGDTSAAVSLPTVPRTGPDGKKLGLWDSLKAAAEEQARAQSAAAGSPRAPRDTLTLPTYTWNDNATELQADIIVLGDAGDDEQTRTDVSYLVEQSLAALATPEVTSPVPAGTEGYGFDSPSLSTTTPLVTALGKNSMRARTSSRTPALFSM